MGCTGSKEKAAPKAAEVPRNEENKPSEHDERPAEVKKDPPKEVVIPQGEPIKLDELDEDFILFEPIEEHYELGEEIGKYVQIPLVFILLCPESLYHYSLPFFYLVRPPTK